MLTRRRFTHLALATPFILASGPSRAASGTTVRMEELYGPDRKSFSALAEQLHGSEVEIQGFMAPPLKVGVKFFLLTDLPADECPFCNGEEDWVETIVFIGMRDPGALDFTKNMIWTRGVLDLGTLKDEETGFVSRVRLLDATFGSV